MSTSQHGVANDRAPRRTTRRSTATPVRDVTPPSHNTQGVSTALQDTPATRRSGRANSRRPVQPRDVVNNNVLPEVQTRQSYAYGSSKTPVLPDQLHVGDMMTMNQVADQMDTAIGRAVKNLDTHAADLEDTRKQAQIQVEKRRTTRHTSKEPSPPASVTTDVQKKQRTAAWASSLDSAHLDDISEEEQPEVDTPETRRTDPSSFPSGTFDHSYQYERGLRPPRKPPSGSRSSAGSRLGAWLGVILDRIISYFHHLCHTSSSLSKATYGWVCRIVNGVGDAVSELPDLRVVTVITRTFFTLVLMLLMSYAFCFSYSRFLCNPSSTSSLALTLESWCGACHSTSPLTNFPVGSQPDIQKLTAALKLVDTQIRSIEARLNSRLDSKVSALHADIDGLRKEQSGLLQQLEWVSNRASQQTSSSDIASPLIPRVNYFSPANGAIVNVQITSPTRQAPIAWPLRLAARMLGIRKYKSHNPVVALEPWHDVGDCWCAASSGPGQDSIRLGVGVREYIFPTELVIEHPPRDVSLTPETAPRRVELWADFGHLQEQEWKELGIEALTKDHGLERNPFGKTYGLIARVEYDLAAHTNHLQRFALDINQYGDLRYSAMDFAVRVRSTHGGEFGCLYRVRLHGVPVERPKNTSGAGIDLAPGQSMNDDEVLG